MADKLVTLGVSMTRGFRRKAVRRAKEKHGRAGFSRYVRELIEKDMAQADGIPVK
jgi:hypothetical protein